MTTDSIPKIFISYSWSSSVMVDNLAQRLVSHGVDVVYDRWDLKEGQDKYAFMERCVNDPTITKVLIICDKKYADKANNRTGGVGDETVIISSEIYGNSKQEKFIPIIAEKDENGKPYVPTYIKSLIYIDLSDESTYEVEYEKLLRNIYDKPLYSKPTLGKKPEWIDEEKTNLFPLKDIIKQIQGSNTVIKRQSCIRKFKDAYIELLKTLWQKNITPEKEFSVFVESKQIRDCFLDYIITISENENEYIEYVSEAFEDMYNVLANTNTFGSGTSESEIDIFRILIWELFILTITYLRHVKDYKGLNYLLTHSYYLISSSHGGRKIICNYTAFRHHSRYIEDVYKPTTDQNRKFTILGDEICNRREKLPVFSKQAIAEADLFLYQVHNALDTPQDTNRYSDSYWFPTFYVYLSEDYDMEWERLKSKKYCLKMLDLFGVETIDMLKDRISKCTFEKDMKYIGAYRTAPNILSSINIEDIGVNC